MEYAPSSPQGDTAVQCCWAGRDLAPSHRPCPPLPEIPTPMPFPYGKVLPSSFPATVSLSWFREIDSAMSDPQRLPTTTRPPGRPPKFSRPSRLVALTLPIDTITALKRIDSDLAHAIVAVAESGLSAPRDLEPVQDRGVDLVQLTDREALIVVNRRLVASLVDVTVLPLDERLGFLALNPGQGFADLEVAVQDSLDDDHLDQNERDALQELKRRLREWRRDPAQHFEVRSIIVGTRESKRARGRRVR